MTLDERLQRVEAGIAKIEDASDRIADSLERLVRLETMHAETRNSVDRAFKVTEKVADDLNRQLDTIAGRLRVIEERQPVHALVVYVVGATVIGILAFAGSALLKAIVWMNGGSQP